MQDVTLLLMNRHTSITASTGRAPAPGSNRDAPLLGRYRAKEGYVMLAGYLPRHQRSILKAIGLSQLADLPSSEFHKRLPEIDLKVETTLLDKTAPQWDQVFSDLAVVAGGVEHLDTVVAGAQTESRKLLVEVDSPAGPQQVTTSGYHINDQVFSPGNSVPTLGEHTKEVLVELGYSEEQINLYLEH
jgi:crotonobetainyl-CoA:carnitine CoA-transferase CaiB-like acyl-CoA transferase